MASGRSKDCGPIEKLYINNTASVVLSPTNDTTFESSALVTCDVGHVVADRDNFQNQFNLTCGQDGKWNEVKDCIRIDCGNLSSLNLSNTEKVLLQKDTKYTSTANISCQMGYTNVNQNQTEGISTTEVICSENGTWENLPNCRKKDCGDLSLLNLTNTENVSLQNDTKYNSTADISCQTGYTDGNQGQIEGISTTEARCSEIGTWENLPNCVKKDCGLIENLNINNTESVVLSPTNDTTFKSSALVTCDVGHVVADRDNFQNQFNMTCGQDGKWNKVTDCVRIDCGNLSPLNLSNTEQVLLQNDTKYTSTANISCQIGYTNVNQNQTEAISRTEAICSENGTWANLPNCVKKDCGDVQNVRMEHAVNRTLLNNTTKYNDTAEITCDLGYYDIDQKQTTGVSIRTALCSNTGKWTDTPKCVPKDCHDVKVITIVHATQRRYNDTKFNSTAEIDCDDGYYDPRENQTTATSTTVIRCSEQGTWTNIPNCIRKDCGSLEMLNISHAANRLIFTDTNYGSSAAITCKTGYYDNNKAQLKGVSSTLMKCSENGTWANVPNCVRKDCGNLTDIKITNAVHRRLHTDTKFKSMADIDCDDGYYIKGRNQIAGISTQTVACSDTGTWTNVPECVPKDCGRLNKLNLSNAENRNPINGTTIYTSLANISCDEGYKELNRSQVLGITYTVVRCNENGTWANLPQCVRKDCGPVNQLHLKNLNLASVQLHDDTKFNSTVDVLCDGGYYNKHDTQTAGLSTTTLTCSKNGTWVNLPSCVPKGMYILTHKFIYYNNCTSF
ncbi:sushi, von Willebrand factor type A, EGF and pentraxin domain-containing protein 1-like [Ruditapes philippinarum]|uniref:sushi, von Willebrand factor type A, EGF and pentraxin domain-containing protein 1-like n=1 Tax=Ruditapes philippinarum TaxID=129788 RepID=UPI00295C02BD|nr:sushi, von Willebrand factor type A, EGF and pentraxin domain-containing protein 1-like [Ruditapes philippinarum]